MKINIEGIEYELDVAAAKEKGCLCLVKTYKAGDRFKDKAGENTFILVNLGGLKMALISLEFGNLWAEPVGVYDTWRVTQEEFDKIVHSGLGNFRFPADYFTQIY